jgi:hypothetical protein
LAGQVVDERITLIIILMKLDMKVPTGCSWLRIGSTEDLMKKVWTFRFHKKQVIS